MRLDEWEGFPKQNRRRGAALAVGILAFTVAALVFFTEVSLSAPALKTLSVELAVTMFCCTVMYCSMADAGALLGQECEGVREAEREWQSAVSEVRGRSLTAGLADFCRGLAIDERRSLRTDLFASVGLSYEEGMRLSSEEGALSALPRRVRRTVRRAVRLRLLRLSPELLLYGAQPRRRTLLPPTATTVQRRSTLRAMLPALLGSALTVSVAIRCREGIDAAAVISAVFRLLALVSTGVRGYGMGYRSVVEDGVSSMRVRASYLHRYLALPRDEKSA